MVVSSRNISKPPYGLLSQRCNFLDSYRLTTKKWHDSYLFTFWLATLPALNCFDIVSRHSNDGGGGGDGIGARYQRDSHQISPQTPMYLIFRGWIRFLFIQLRFFLPFNCLKLKNFEIFWDSKIPNAYAWFRYQLVRAVWMIPAHYLLRSWAYFMYSTYLIELPKM